MIRIRGPHPVAASLALVVAAALILAGCSGSGEDSPSAQVPGATGNCATPSPAATPVDGEEQSVTTAEGKRTYQVWTPAGYDGTSRTPLLLLFHGTAGTPDAIAAFTGLTTVAPLRGYLVVAPQALTGPDGPTARWTVPGFGTAPDDVAFTEALIDTVSSRYCIEPNRVYATGFSSGGAFTQYLSCRIPERFGAVAPLAGANLVRDCPTAAAVPWISFHGTADPYVSFSGNVKNPTDPATAYFGNIEQTAAEMARRNGCPGARYFDTDVTDDVVLRTFNDCSASTVLAIEKGAGHTFPGSELSAADEGDRGVTIMDYDGAAALLAFFDSHPRNPAPTPAR